MSGGQLEGRELNERLPRDIDNAIVAVEWEIKQKRKRMRATEAKTELTENDLIKIGTELQFIDNINKLIKSFRNTFHASLGRIPPCDIELEKAIVGGLMLESEARPDHTRVIDQVKTFLLPEHMYMQSHVEIYAAILELNALGHPTDLMSVKNHLRKKGKLDLIGGAYYLVECTTVVSSTATIGYNARVLVEFAIKRQLITVCAGTLRNLYDDMNDVFDELDHHSDEVKKCYSWIKK